jgi:dTMP kinase
MKGLLISIEGIDGSGKTTLASLLYNKLQEQNINAILTKEPGDTKLGKNLRTILNSDEWIPCDKAEYLLFAADRAQHIEEVVTPALNEGKIVISDRMGDSSVAYQGYGRQLEVPMIESINQWAMNNIPPDLTFYIYRDIPTALGRISNRGEKLTSFEQEEKEFWIRTINGFESIFKNRNNVARLDGTNTAEQLCEEALKIVLEKQKQHV